MTALYLHVGSPCISKVTFVMLLCCYNAAQVQYIFQNDAIIYSLLTCFVSEARGQAASGILMRTRVGISASVCPLRSNVGPLLNQRSDFLGSVVAHASLCDRETRSKESLCCLRARALFRGALLWLSPLPSNYWRRNKPSFCTSNSSLCVEKS